LKDRNYRPPFEILAKPSGLTVTRRPGCLNITFAAAAVICLPKRQWESPLSPWPLAHWANSSGVGVCPSSAAQRRTMKPSIILLGGRFFAAHASLMIGHYLSKHEISCKIIYSRLSNLPFNASLCIYGRSRLATVFEISLHRMRQLLSGHRSVHH